MLPEESWLCHVKKNLPTMLACPAEGPLEVVPEAEEPADVDLEVSAMNNWP